MIFLNLRINEKCGSIRAAQKSLGDVSRVQSVFVDFQNHSYNQDVA